MSAPELFALSQITGSMFWILRVVAAIGAMIVGWFLAGPVARLMYRGVFRRPAPRWLTTSARLGGAALFGLLVYFILPLGGGGGFGWGPGAGGAPGLGAGTGSAKIANDEGTDAGKETVAKQTQRGLENLEIALIGGKRYQDDERFYLLNRREPVVDLDHVEKYLKENSDHLAEYVTIVLAPTSVDALHGAVLRLSTVIEKYDRIPRIVNVPADGGPG
jgi:hypothetical protein